MILIQIFRLLKLLKESNNINDKKDYDKFIKKYKYTLDFLDAKELKCFEEIENQMTKEFKNNFQKNSKTEIKKKSLAKIQLVNLLFYLFNIKEDPQWYYDDKKLENEAKKVINKI